MKEEDAKIVSPPYVAFRTLLNFIERLEKGTIPYRIDRSYWGSFLAGSNGAQLMLALRFLGLIQSQAGEPTEALERLVEARDEERKQVLKSLLEQCYAPIFSDVDVARATMGHMESAFTNAYKVVGDTRRKAVAFFVHAARYAGITLSPHITEKTKARRATQSVANGSRSSARRAHQAPQSEIPTQVAPPPATGMPTATADPTMVDTVSFPDGGGYAALSYNVNLFRLDERDRTFLLDLVDKFRAYTANRVGEKELKRDEGAKESETDVSP